MFKQKFNTNTVISKRINKFVVDAEKIFIDRLIDVGRSAAEYAKLNNEYTDRTFNLDSSTGFAVHLNGVLLHQEYSGIGLEGLEAGKQLAEFNGKSHEGIVVTVTAGMFYGGYVEAKGYDVLTQGSKVGRAYFLKVFNELKKLKKAK